VCKRTRLIVFILSLPVVIGAVAVANHRSSVPVVAAAVAPAAPVVPVQRQAITSTLTVAGQFQAFQEVDLHAKVSGYIRRINVDIGDRVKAGQVIATLEVPELNAQLSGTQAEVRHSQSEITRAESEVARAAADYSALHAAYSRLQQAAQQRPGLIAEQELDDARAKDQHAAAQVDVAKASFEASQQQLGVSRADRERAKTLSDYSVVTAPFAGVVTMRYADTGSLIQAGTASNTQAMPVVRVAESDLLRLRMPVPESSVPYIQEGGTVDVRVPANGKHFVGRIIRFTRSLDPSTRTMLVEVDVPNSDMSLSPGMYAETVITLQNRPNVLVIPLQALVQNQAQPYVLVVDSANRIEKRAVTLGIHGPEQVEIVSGLEQGENVVVSAQSNYQPGETVRPKLDDMQFSEAGGRQ
jgi:RND family efflux transporter MFP subunit